MPDQHPADGLIHSIVGLFNGDTFKQGLRDAWDQHFGNVQMPETNPEAAKQTQANNDAAVQRANQSFLTQSQAARVRQGASTMLGGK